MLRRLSAVVVALLIAPAVGFGQTDEAPAKTDEIPGLIRQLDSDRFVEREEAMVRLAAAGPIVVDPLGAAMKNGTREVITRGAYILLQLARSKDLQIAEPAYQALRSLRDAPQRTAAIVARRHVAEIQTFRQNIALKDLLERGAELKEEFFIINPAQAEPAQTIEIGDAWRGADDDLKKLAWLYNIRFVAFKSNRIRREWLKYAAQMESLESLSVRGGDLDDEGIQAFVAAQPQLRNLELKYVPVTNVSVPKLQESLPNLISLKLYGTKITRERAEELRAAMPRLDLDYRRGGFLGVGCQTHQLGCHIARVQAGSAASRAGFVPGDVIISYGGEPVPDFDALTELISANEVEAKVRIEIIRNVQTSAMIVACTKGSLKIKTKPHRLGDQFESMADDSPLRRPSQIERNPFSIGNMRQGDVIFRINGREIPKGKTADEVYQSVCDEVRIAALERAKAEVAAMDDPPESEEERDKLIDKIADQEVREERILIQFARGGTFVTRDVVLGAWD